LTIWDLDRTFHAGSFGVATLRALLDRLRATYAGTLGVQYMHIETPEERSWLEQRMESSANQWPLEPATRRKDLKDWWTPEGFELFLDSRFKAISDFPLEGGEAMLAIVTRCWNGRRVPACRKWWSACRIAGD